MENAESLKDLVREKYGQLAREGGGSCGTSTSCCGPAGAGSVNFSEDYTALEGYVREADLGLGCGIPIDAADLRPGQTVLDLGSGAGNDVFVARRAVGETGKVIGVDMTPDMIKKARGNAAKAGYANVEFRLGELEALPVESASVDRILSNCVLNLVPDKAQAFREMHRVLKPGGRFGVSDVVVDGELPKELRKEAELYVGCVAGAMQKGEYLAALRATGFEDVRVAKEKLLEIPGMNVKVISVTVQGSKLPETKTASSCCTPIASAGGGPCCHPA